MRILDSQVDWQGDVAHDLQLESLVDEVPSRDEHHFKLDGGIGWSFNNPVGGVEA